MNVTEECLYRRGLAELKYFQKLSSSYGHTGFYHPHREQRRVLFNVTKLKHEHSLRKASSFSSQQFDALHRKLKNSSFRKKCQVSEDGHDLARSGFNSEPQLVVYK